MFLEETFAFFLNYLYLCTINESEHSHLKLNTNYQLT